MDRWWVRILIAGLLMGGSILLIEPPLYSRVAVIASICLYIWIGGLAPTFVPTLILWAAIPILLAPLDERYSIVNVLRWAADPVIALFFGGFCLGVATRVYGIDRNLADFARAAGGRSFPVFLLLVVLITAFLSMWLSNIAAAALILACLRPVFGAFDPGHTIRRTLLVGVALGADLGGIATPIGTGPNAIAMASVGSAVGVSFLRWMVFAFPITIGMLALGIGYLCFSSRKAWTEWHPTHASERPLDEKATPLPRSYFILLGIATVALWLSEPLHGIPSAVVALGAAAVLFLTGMLRASHLLEVDWSTLLLIAGGITLGRLLEHSGIIREAATGVPFASFDTTQSLFIICFASALLSALMSNTATVVLLIPIASAIIPAPSTAILVAISASFGMPFVISTPQNAMVSGEGGLRFADLFVPGILIMFVGCLLVSVTGKAVLNLVGIP